MDDKGHTFETGNAYDETFEAFQETALYGKLKEKFTPKPYYVRYRGLRKLALVASYAFNVLSATTASMAVYFFMVKFQQSLLLAGGITVVFMVLLELAKRMTGSNFIRGIFQYRKPPIGMLTVLSGLVILSVVFSYTGSKKMIHEFVPEPVLVNADSLTAPHKAEIVKIDGQIEKARGTTYKGTTTRTSQQTINLLTDQRKIIQGHVFEIEREVREENRATMQTFLENNEGRASKFALFTLICELFFLMSLFYLEYYDFRSFGEFAKTKKISEDSGEVFQLLKSHIDKEAARLVADKLQSLLPELEDSELPLQKSKPEIPESQEGESVAESPLQESQGALQDSGLPLQESQAALQDSGGHCTK